jgi:hypothetical protein
MTEQQAEYGTPDAGNMELSELVQQDGLALRPITALNLQQADYVLSTLWGVRERSQFYIGDLLNFCKATLGETYSQLIDETHYNIKTLQNFMWVSDRVRPNGRWDTLTFDHHASCAALEPEEQDQWLELAAKGGWSCRRLREEIRGPKAEKEPKPKVTRCPECTRWMVEGQECFGCAYDRLYEQLQGMTNEATDA